MATGRNGQTTGGRPRPAAIRRPRLTVLAWGLIAFLLTAAAVAPAVNWLREELERRSPEATGAAQAPPRTALSG
ncbi:hypothetical protein [Phenylobacterium sp.]|jgi:hypothetical protein|uniref:hypothetical protein n=1 Tax=Phenylobacterium sp. TaxID=1871053 RepID=UPI002F93B450